MVSISMNLYVFWAKNEDIRALREENRAYRLEISELNKANDAFLKTLIVKDLQIESIKQDTTTHEK